MVLMPIGGRGELVIFLFNNWYSSVRIHFKEDPDKKNPHP